MSAPYFPLYVDDYDAATAHLTLEEDGAYGRLLRICWRTPGCSIPSDPAWIARKLRLSLADYERVAVPVIEEFFTLARGRLFQKRLRDEWLKLGDKSRKRSEAGKKGASAKALKTKTIDPSNADVLPAYVRASPEPEPEPEPKPDDKEESSLRSDSSASDELVLVGELLPIPDPVQIAYDTYNRVAEEIGVTVATVLSDKRRKHIAARLKESGMDGFQDALIGMAESAFCRGHSEGGFVASLDFVLTASKFIKLRERQYGTEYRGGPNDPTGYIRSTPVSSREHQYRADSDAFRDAARQVIEERKRPKARG